jgi:hypothetical protein
VEGLSAEEYQKLMQALRLVDEGEKGKVMQVLKSLGLAEVNESTMRITRAMFGDDPDNPPQGCDVPAFAPPVPFTQEGAAAPEPPAAAPHDPSVQAQDILRQAVAPVVAGLPAPNADVVDPPEESMWSRKKLGQYLSQKIHVAADFLGWNGGTLLYLVQNLNAKAYAGFVDLLQLCLEGAIDNVELLSELRRSRGHLLNKDGPAAVRAIGVVSWWMQVPAALQIRRCKEVMVEKLGKENVAVGVPGGSEALARAVQLAREEHPNWVVLATDCTAAFPSIFRACLLEAGKALLCLTGNVTMHYGAPTSSRLSPRIGVCTTSIS